MQWRMIPRFHHAVQVWASRVDAPEDRLGCSAPEVRRPRRLKTRASATGQRFGGCFDEHVVQRGYALTPRTRRDDDAKSAFAGRRHAAALALGSNVPTCGCEQSQQATGNDCKSCQADDYAFPLNCNPQNGFYSSPAENRSTKSGFSFANGDCVTHMRQIFPVQRLFAAPLPSICPAAPTASSRAALRSGSSTPTRSRSKRSSSMWK
jgi:hypothetical protein